MFRIRIRATAILKSPILSRSSVFTFTPAQSSTSQFSRFYATSRVLSLRNINNDENSDQKRSFLKNENENESQGNERQAPSSIESKSRLGAIGLGAAVLFGKTKYLLAALKLTKMSTLLSMLLTSFAYSFFFGWPFALGAVGLIFVHECGHAIVMHRMGVPFSPMVFIPFLGAVVAMKESPKSALEEAQIAFGGPVLGSLAAAACSVIGIATNTQLLIALADFGFMINLFNMFPIGSMDGGRIANAISPWFGLVGVAAGGAMVFYSVVGNPLFVLIVLGGAYTSGSRLFGWDENDKRGYYKTKGQDQVALIVAYLTTVGLLIFGMTENNKYRISPKRLREGVTMPQQRDGREQDPEMAFDDYFDDREIGSSESAWKTWTSDTEDNDDDDK